MKKRILYALMVAILVIAFTLSTVGADSAIPLDQLDWDKLAPQEEKGYTLQPDQIIYTDDGISVDGTATPLSPITEYVYKKKPIFYFTRDYAASMYSIGVYDDYWGEFVYAGYTDKGTCTSYYCYIRPDVKLEPAGLFHTGYYEWDVISKVGGYWQSWSPWQSFRVMLKKFNDTFDLVPTYWWYLYGDWYWLESKGQMKGYAYTGYWASMLRDGYFYNVDYTVMMKRKDNISESNAVTIWGQPAPYGTNHEWYNGITFQYTNNGYYSIWKEVNGVWSWIQPWTPSSAINQYGWNELRIVGNFPYFDVWLNGTYLGWWYDNAVIYGGYTGVGMYGGGVYDQKLMVDYARATAVQYTSLAERDPSMQLGLEPAPEGMSPTSAPMTWDNTGTR
jgi:hypothetical protein